MKPWDPSPRAWPGYCGDLHFIIWMHYLHYLNSKVIFLTQWTSIRKEYLFKWCKKYAEFLVRLTNNNFVLHTAFLDEVMVEVFKIFCLNEMLKILWLVSRRWRHIVNNNNILWSCLLLDEWHIRYLNEEQFINIMSHSSGFRYLSIKYIEMRTSEKKLETSLGNSLGFSKHLRYLDLSGQPISSLNFL